MGRTSLSRNLRQFQEFRCTRLEVFSWLGSGLASSKNIANLLNDSSIGTRFWIPSGRVPVEVFAQSLGFQGHERWIQKVSGLMFITLFMFYLLFTRLLVGFQNFPSLCCSLPRVAVSLFWSFWICLYVFNQAPTRNEGVVEEERATGYPKPGGARLQIQAMEVNSYHLMLQST